MASAAGAAAITAAGTILSGMMTDNDSTVTTTTNYAPFQVGSYSTDQMDELYALLGPYLKSAFSGDTGGAKTVPYKSQAGKQTVASLSPYKNVAGYSSKPTSLPWV